MTNEQTRPGATFRWTRRLLLLLAGLTFLVWFLSISGLYFWFNLGSENRLRFEYGRLVWRHVDGGTARQTAGVDGGASRSLWSYEHAQHGRLHIFHIPLWMPFLTFVAVAVGMTAARRRRRRADP